MTDGSNWSDCPWDPGEVRLLGRGLAKSLVQARRLTEPNFLPADQVLAWFPPDGAELGGNGRSARTLLGHAATAARRLQVVGVLPAEWHTSATPVPGPAAAGELVSAVQRLLSGNVTAADPVAALERTARMSAPQPGWVRLVAWDELPELHRLLALFPDPAGGPPAVAPRWDPDAGELRYGRWVARRVSPNADNIRTLLGTFTAAGWPASIPTPFRGGAPVLHETLKRLRDGLRGITFRSRQGGTVVFWEPVGKNNASRKRNTRGTKRTTHPPGRKTTGGRSG